MKQSKTAGWTMAALAVITAAAVAVPPAMAQRDPAYAAARSSGQVGEQPDGYLGFASTPTAEVRALVQDLNIKRKASYTEGAQSTGTTVEQYAFTSGCNLIAKTAAGEKYKAPDGSWKTRDGSPPVRDSRCP